MNTSNIKYHNGDATNPIGNGQKIICHICNDAGGWGAGFVVAISNRWPEPEHQYRTWHHYGDMAGFGLGKSQLVRCTNTIFVFNMIAQHNFVTNDRPPIRYDSLKECLISLAEEAKTLNASIHMPRIGCGLAGGTWDKIEPIIEEALAGLDVNVYDL